MDVRSELPEEQLLHEEDYIKIKKKWEGRGEVTRVHPRCPDGLVGPMIIKITVEKDKV
jgi:hypothetical protein